MSLKTYRSKRNFKETNEPPPKVKKRTQQLRFCVQKHAASHLHYDFRLEYRGVLLSWAVPKGPSMNPQDKRLAIKVEDHPYDYRTFEGVIPKGNYGAGTVLLWDEGTFSAYGAESPQDSERLFTAGLEKGHLEFVLNGSKLKGKFSLIQLKNRGSDNSWLLIKGKDDHASTEDILEQDYSVKSKTNQKKNSKQTLELKNLKKSKRPEWISPMLAKLIDKPFNDENWLFEIKWDGYRALAFVDHSTVELFSRNHNSFNHMYPAVVEALKKMKVDAILDGEIVSLDSAGKSKFELLKNYQRHQEGNLCYMIFDLLYYDGRDLRSLPLIERKDMLSEILKSDSTGILRFSDHIEAKGIEFFKAATKKNLEGIVGKEKESEYLSKRSSEWVKIKTALRQEVVIGGYTQPRGSRQDLGALLVGIYSGKELQYIGHVGGGFNRESLKEVYKALQPLIQKTCPFKNAPKPNEVVTWVKPKLICEISFAEWTADEKIRQPIFHGLRSDKNPKTVKKEVAEQMNHDNNPKEDSFTHLDKIYWKKENYTKGDVIEYYRTVAPFILPYLKNRPLMMHRFPNGIEGENFYQKDMKNPPKWMETAVVEHESKSDHYVLVQNLQTLLYVANLGSLELHPWISHVPTLDHPDFVVIDLDPEGVEFKVLVETALHIHEYLEKYKIPNYCKTSGSRGLHIYIPTHAQYPFKQTEVFAELLAHLIQQLMPSLISLERRPAKRQKKIYVDYLQNLHGGRTMVAPYSLRPKPGAPVSTPLEWKEVNARLDPQKFNIKTIPARLKKIGDIFKPILTKRLDLKKALSLLEG